MNKDLLIQGVVDVLTRAGFVTSEICNVRPRSFDLAARRDQLLLLLKVLSNIDGLNEETAYGMRQLAVYLLGSPLVVGEKSRDHPLESGVVYFRFGIPAVDIKTLHDYLIEDLPPLIYAAHGGLYVSLKGEILREERIQKGVSLGALASELGVSRRTISKYEESEMDASVNVALKLEEILNKALVLPIEILKIRESLNEVPPAVKSKIELSILDLLSDIGLKVVPTSQAPFDAVSFPKERRRDRTNTILTGVSEHTSAMVKRAWLMSSISEVAQTHSVFIVDEASKFSHIGETVLVEKTELKEVNDSWDFINLIKEKKHRIEVS
jgi:putative transcriptional regulator